MQGRRPVDFSVAEGMRTVLQTKQVLYLEPRRLGDRLRVILLEPVGEADEGALSVAGVVDLVAPTDGELQPARLLLDDGWLELTWLD